MNNTLSISPISLLQTLSMALDLAVNGVNAHQWRTAVICSHIAQEMGIRPMDQNTLLIGAMLHDIGAAPNMDERQRLLDPNQEEVIGRDIHLHAEAGYQLLHNASWMFDQVAEDVRYHHDSWNGGNPSGLERERIPLNSRIILVADRIDVLTDKTRPVFDQVEKIRKFLLAGRDKKFDPEVVDAFLRCSEVETFWLDLANPEYQSTLLAKLSWGQAQITAKEFLDIAELFATIIDRMSIFTATHSRSVAQVAVLLGRMNGFCENELYLLKVAGLLHDLGKLSVPNSILEKPGRLTPQEMVIIRQHSYYTYRILERIECLRTVAQWAGFHHETLDGMGYPFRVGPDALPLGARILAVADVFVALAEDRPYRARMEKSDIVKILGQMAAEKKIDDRIVAMLIDNYQAADEMVTKTGPDFLEVRAS